jgi:hypothetical protein
MSIGFKKIILPGIVFYIFLLGSLFAQEPGRLRIDHLDRLSAKAEEVVDVNLDGPMLQMARKFLSDDGDNDSDVKELIRDLTGIFVKSFEFDKEGEYSQEDLEAIRSQIPSGVWSRIVGVRSRKNGENVDVFVRMKDDKMAGLVVIAADPKELTVVNLVGAVDVDKLSRLEGQFGIPKMELEKTAKPEKSEKPKPKEE